MENEKKNIENQIKDLKDKIKNKRLERGEAIREDGWHDNATVDSINTEIYFLESKLRDLNNQLLKII